MAWFGAALGAIGKGAAAVGKGAKAAGKAELKRKYNRKIVGNGNGQKRIGNELLSKAMDKLDRRKRTGK